MTLLINFYSSRGIVFAADSAITIDYRKGKGPERTPKQRKIQRTRRLGLNGGVVGYFGLARVGTKPMDRWLRETLDSWNGSAVAADLGNHLVEKLNKEVTKADRLGTHSGFHIGAFERRDDVAVPVMQYVSNIYGFNSQTARYSNFGEYRTEEHFPRHPQPEQSWDHVPRKELRAALRTFERERGLPWWFRNGALAFSSRTWDGLEHAVANVTRDLKKSGFGLPDDISKWETVAHTIVRTTGVLYELLSTRGEPVIEGPYVKTSIPWRS